MFPILKLVDAGPYIKLYSLYRIPNKDLTAYMYTVSNGEQPYLIKKSRQHLL